VRVLGRDADIVGRTINTRLNQIYGRQEKYILLEVEVEGSPAGQTRTLASVSVDYTNMATKHKAHIGASKSVTFTGSAKLVRDSANSKVMVAAVEQVANITNKRALVLRDQGKIGEARNILLGNERYLNDNASKYGSSRLKNFGRTNRSDADNLSPERWDRQRKRMRKTQYEFDSQQAW